jgi:acetyl esterase/lipase
MEVRVAAQDVLTRTPPRADYRVKYGPGDLQFGDLFLPSLRDGRRAPVVVFIHGGWWKNQYGLEYGGHLCQALKHSGIAAWSIEYRRVGDSGGGWPGTFEDTAAGFDFLGNLAKTYPLDLNHVAVAGHSAGGHLAFWLAGRPNIPESSPLHRPQPALAMHGVVALAGAVDLRLTIDLSGYFTFAHDKREVETFLGGSPSEAPDRYRAGNPGDLLPITTPQWLVQGTEDDQIPPRLPDRWAERGRRMGERVTLDMIPGADHFDVVDPESRAWPRVQEALRAALG